MFVYMFQTFLFAAAITATFAEIAGTTTKLSTEFSTGSEKMTTSLLKYTTTTHAKGLSCAFTIDWLE